MVLFKIEDMKDGWFIGDFEPTSFVTKEFEVCYKTHYKEEKWSTHYHKKATEINLLISGRMVIQGTELKAGDIFILNPYEIADPVFLEECKLVIIKTPSIPNDKYIIHD